MNNKECLNCKSSDENGLEYTFYGLFKDKIEIEKNTEVNTKTETMSDSLESVHYDVYGHIHFDKESIEEKQYFLCEKCHKKKKRFRNVAGIISVLVLFIDIYIIFFYADTTGFQLALGGLGIFVLAFALYSLIPFNSLPEGDICDLIDDSNLVRYNSHLVLSGNHETGDKKNKNIYSYVTNYQQHLLSAKELKKLENEKFKILFAWELFDPIKESDSMNGKKQMVYYNLISK